MTVGETGQVGRYMAILLRTLFSFVVAAALCSSSEPFDFSDQRLSFSSSHQIESATAFRLGDDPQTPIVVSLDDQDFSGLVAVDPSDGDPTLPHSTRSLSRFCSPAPEIVFTVANQSSLRCSSRPRAPPADIIG